MTKKDNTNNVRLEKGYSPAATATNGYKPSESGSDTYGYSPSKTTASTTTSAPKPPKSQ